MPFLPFVLLLAWQAVSRSASFALGWATALYFGQVPGRQGRILAVISLLAPGVAHRRRRLRGPASSVGAALEAAGVIEENFDVEPLHLPRASSRPLVLTPPGVAASVVYGDFRERRDVRDVGAARARSRIRRPSCSASPCCRWCCSRRSCSSSAGARSASSSRSRSSCARTPTTTTCSRPVETALRAAGIDDYRRRGGDRPEELADADRRLRGAPSRSVRSCAASRFASSAGDLEVLAYATNVSIIGPAGACLRGPRRRRARGRVPRRLPRPGTTRPRTLEDELVARRQHGQRRPRPAAPPARPHPGAASTAPA